MKGPASAKLPALHTGSLVASPCANPCPKRKKNEQRKKAKDKKEKKTHIPQLDCEGIVKTLPETGNKDIIATGNSSAKKELKLTVLLPNDKGANLGQRKMAQLEAHFRHKGANHKEKRLFRESSVTSLRQSRLVSAKSRDHLLSLIPTKDALENNRNCNYQDIVNSAKRELDWIIKKSVHSGLSSRRESGELNTLFKQTKKASRLREACFGKHEKALTNVDHVIDSCNKRAYFLAPISAQDLSVSSVNHSKCEDGQIKWREHLQMNQCGQNSVKARIDLSSPKTELNERYTKRN